MADSNNRNPMGDSKTTKYQKDRIMTDIVEQVDILSQEGIDEIYLHDLRRALYHLKQRRGNTNG